MEFRVTADRQIRLALGLRARSAAELLLVQRMQAFRWMYQHPRVVAAEALMRAALEHLDNLRGETDLIPLAIKALQNLYPPLNYVRESSSYRISGLAVNYANPEGEGVSNLQLELPLEVIPEGDSADPSQSIFSEIQASVNDDSVIRYCSSVAVCFRHAINQGATDEKIRRYLHLYDVSLRRSSALVVLWKRHEEFSDVAEEVFGSQPVIQFRERFQKDIAEVADRLSGEMSPDELDLYVTRAAKLINNPVGLFNYLGYRLLYRLTDDVGDWLTTQCPDISGNFGFWHCTFFARQNPLHSMQQGVHLEGRGGVDVSLRESSPLVASIDEVEDQSPKFHVSFVITGRSRNISIGRSELRSRLRENFKEKFPIYIREHLQGDKLGTKGSMWSLYTANKRRQTGR